ncbi:hypothetical protein CRM22_003353 [Opisthorchis felineus]|uniref:ATP-dependent RNA helicase Ski2/MTR4 C-terminal domain-containing protein n=1 Tax=Opisthorchis felineus TaxID=147828 RepID=A0A4S2M1M7_OPIFE|nr:hypothetical protein CRM22_003353 [Opisthorchis felineus]
MKQFESYVKLKEALASANCDRRALATESESVIPLLQPDRVVKAVHALESRVSLNPLASRPDIDQLVDIYTQRTLLSFVEVELNRRVYCLNVSNMSQSIEDELRRARNVLDKKNAIFHELQARKRFLRQLGFCSETDAVTFKGRVACEISSGDELILTELMLDNFFSSLTPAQLAGVLSCFVVKKSFGKHRCIQLRSDMAQALETIKTKARSLARVAIECGICYSGVASDPTDGTSGDICELAALLNRVRLLDDEQACVDRFSGDLMEVVRAWAEGLSFSRLRELAPVSDGNVIRCLRKLNGLLHQMHNAAKVAGNTELGNKFLEGRL